MAKYVAGKGSFYHRKRMYRPGSEVVLPDDERPPQHLIPVDDAAKAAYAKHHGGQAPQTKPVVKEEPDKPQSMLELQQEIDQNKVGAEKPAPKAKPEPQSKFNMADLLTGKK